MIVISQSAIRQTASEMLRFGIATGLSAVVSLGLPIGLHELLHIDQRIAVAISQASVLAMNFLTLRLFVFRSSGKMGADVFRYGASAVMFRGLEYASFLLLFEVAHMFYVTALVVTLCVSTVAKFVWYRFIFGQSGSSAERSSRGSAAHAVDACAAIGLEPLIASPGASSLATDEAQRSS